MAPAKKAKAHSKRFAAVNAISSKNNDSKQKKKKLADMLGPEWSKQELTRFYDAYRKYGRDWKKIANILRDRSVEMVEALYNMNRAYLSLPEGTASVVGLIAMMTDHYNVLEGGGSDGNSDDSDTISLKPRRFPKGKVQAAVPRDGVAQAGRCISSLKLHLNGIQPHIPARKRTPRIPVSYLDDEYYLYNLPTNKKAKILEANRDDDDFTHGTRGLKPDHIRYELDKEMTVYGIKSGGSARGSDSRKEVEDDDSEQFHDMVEDCSGAGKSYRMGLLRKKLGFEAYNGRGADFPALSVGKTNKKHFLKDDPPNFDALMTLVDLSLQLPTSTAETVESSRESVIETDKKVALTARSPTLTGTAGRGYKRRRKSLAEKTGTTEEEDTAGDTIVDSPSHCDTKFTDENPGRKYKRKCNSQAAQKHQMEERIISHPSKLVEVKVAAEGETKSTDGLRQENQLSKLSGICPLARSCDGQRPTEADVPASSTQVGTSSLALPPLRGKNRRKAERSPFDKCPQSGDLPSRLLTLPHGRAMTIKDKLSNQFSSRKFRRWCAFEWFYSAIDYPWFAQREFVEYLNHVGLGHIPRLMHVEWGVIRSSLGRPRRFSERFLLKERDKLAQYRESVRRHYTKLRADSREGLPSDLARPLAVGQRVIAIHPKTREIHDGRILTVDHDKCRVQFDHIGLGVEIIKDIDCMPSNPMENMPEALRRHRLASGFANLKGPEIGGRFPFPSIQHLNSVNVYNGVPPASHSLKNQPKADVGFTSSHDKAMVNGSLKAQSGTQTLPSSLVLNQSREGDRLPAPEVIYPVESKPIIDSVDPSRNPSSPGSYSLGPEEPESNLVEIIKSSRENIHGRLDTAAMAISSVKEGENVTVRVLESLYATDKCAPATSSIGASMESHTQTNTTILQQQLTDVHSGANSLEGYEGMNPQIPPELITSCVTVVDMVKKCTERQHPPAEVAQLLDTVTKSLHPGDTQNQSIYKDIETVMGHIKTGTIALVPTVGLHC